MRESKFCQKRFLKIREVPKSQQEVCTHKRRGGSTGGWECVYFAVT